MKYAFVTLAILAIWIGLILVALINPEVGVFLPIFAMGLMVVIFIIGFGRKQ